MNSLDMHTTAGGSDNDIGGGVVFLFDSTTVEREREKKIAQN